MLRHNLWTQAGLTNGSTGIIRNMIFESESDEAPTCLLIEFDDYDGKVFFEDNPKLVPIFKKDGPIKNCSDKRINFPVELCYSLTIHKSQGMSIDRAYIDIGSKEDLGLSYVAFSRLKSCRNLVLKNFNKSRFDMLNFNDTKPHLNRLDMRNKDNRYQYSLYQRYKLEYNARMVDVDL